MLLFFPKIANDVDVTYRCQTCLLMFCLFFGGAEISVGSDLGPQPSEFRAFTDKRGQQIEARILSISDDKRQLNLVRRDGRAFELAITLLSLDDQQFLNDWLSPPEQGIAPGPVQVFGVLPGDIPIDVDALEGIDDIVSIHASKRGWIVRRSSGEVMSFEDRYPDIADATHLYVNTVWIYGCQDDGTVSGAGGNSYFEDTITSAVQCVGGNGQAAVLLNDGTVKVWGRAYDTKEPIDPPVPLVNIVALSSTQGRITAINSDGRMFSWSAGKAEVFESEPGGGVVEVLGGIYDNIALTKSGEVFTWNRPDVGTAKTPAALQGEGPFQKIRCNGVTFAAQREDGSWIAWGRNSSGIVDHINELGPVSDIAFFSEPGSQELGYVIWR